MSPTWDCGISCKNDPSAIGEDSVIVRGLDLPQTYSWNVTRGVDKARSMGAANLTFISNGFKLEFRSREIVPGQKSGPKESVGFVRFWPRERGEFGLAAVPTLIVNHSESRTALVDFLSYTIRCIVSVCDVLRPLSSG